MEHEDNKDRDDSFTCARSPSFKDYCNDNDSGKSKKNSGDDGSTNIQNKSENEEILNSNKETEKKERRKRRFGINRGKTGGKRNLLNFGCFTCSSESSGEASTKKIVRKTS